MKKIYFLHIPKTGGTSVKQWLEDSAQTKKLTENGWESIHLGHSYFKNTESHGVRSSAGIRLRQQYPYHLTGAPTISDLKDGVVFTIARPVSTWLPSYFASSSAGWHQCQWANALRDQTRLGWDKFFEKFYDSHVNGFPWYHGRVNDRGPMEKFPANEWCKSNIWQLYNDDQSLMIDYVINFENLNRGLELMFEDLDINITLDGPESHAHPCRLNKNPLISVNKDFNKSLEEFKKTKDFEHYKDSREFFKDSSDSLYVTRKNTCI